MTKKEEQQKQKQKEQEGLELVIKTIHIGDYGELKNAIKNVKFCRPVYKKKCTECPKKFLTTNETKPCCSPACKQKAYRNRLSLKIK